MCESETHEGTSFMNILNIKEGQHYIAKIESHSFVDGEGVRCSVYVSGCPFQCKVVITFKPKILNMENLSN